VNLSRRSHGIEHHGNCRGVVAYCYTPWYHLAYNMAVAGFSQAPARDPDGVTPAFSTATHGGSWRTGIWRIVVSRPSVGAATGMPSGREDGKKVQRYHRIGNA